MQCREMCSNLVARAKWDHLGTLVKVQHAGKHSLRLAECKCYSAGMAGTGEGLQNHKWPTPQFNRQAAPNPISNYNAAFVKTNKATKCMNVVNYWTCSWPPTAIALLEISREAVKLPFSHRRAPRDPRVFRLQHDKSNHPCSQWLRFFWQSLTRHSSMQLKHMCKCVPYL